MSPTRPMAVRLAADLHPSADGSAVRTSLVAGQLQAASVPIAYRLGQTDGWTDERIRSPPVAKLQAASVPIAADR